MARHRPPETSAPDDDRVPGALDVVRVAGHVVRERITRPVPVDGSDVPRSADAITAGWLDSVLCTGVPGARVVDVTAGAGSDGTTNRRSLQVSYNQEGRDAGLPEHLFAKSTATLTTRVLNGFSGIIKGEIGFYNAVRPTLDVEAPSGYYAAYDPRSLRSVVVMDDIVATKGATFCTTADDITLEEMAGILGVLARCHARFYDSPRLDELTWLKTPQQFQNRITSSLNFRKLCDRGSKRASDLLPPALHGKGDRVWEAFGESLAINAEGPRCFLHGDSHIRNFYRTNEGRMGACDWQITLKGHWAFDFAYSVTSALTVENRRAWERDLLERYLAELAEFGGPSLSFDDAWLSYRQHTIYPFYGFVSVVGAGRLLPKMQPMDACRQIIERTANAVVDLDSLGALERA